MSSTLRDEDFAAVGVDAMDEGRDSEQILR